MLRTCVDELQNNPHCAQSASEHRHSFTDIEFSTNVNTGQAPSAEYVDLKQEEHSVTHWGQMKLLLGEIEFLTPYLSVSNLTIVYAGSSPGHHLMALVNLMPSSWQWLLYDARPCEVYYTDGDAQLEKVGKSTIVLTRVRNHRVHVYTRNLNAMEARCIRDRHVVRPQSVSDPQLLLISDIRTPLNRISEHSVNRDMDLQLNITRALGPFQASLKFKLPYTNLFLPTAYYVKGSLQYQPYSPPISHETRLVAGPDFTNLVPYNTEEYARQMFHYQTVLRTSLYHRTSQVADPALHPFLVEHRVATDHCYDCTCARRIAGNFTDSNAMDLLNDLAGQVSAMQLACKAESGNMLDE